MCRSTAASQTSSASGARHRQRCTYRNRSVARTTDDRKRVQAKVEKTKPQQAARHDRMDKPQIRSTRPEKQVKRYSQQRADKPTIERQRVKAPERQRAERSKVERKRVERVVKERSFSK